MFCPCHVAVLIDDMVATWQQAIEDCTCWRMRMCVLLAVLVRQGRRRRLVSNKKGVNLISRTNAFVHNWQLALAIGIAGNMACQHTCTQHTHNTHTHKLANLQRGLRLHFAFDQRQQIFARVFVLWILNPCTACCLFCERFLKNCSNYWGVETIIIASLLPALFRIAPYRIFIAWLQLLLCHVNCNSHAK